MPLTARTSYYQLPLTISLMASNVAYERVLHCIECGHPFIGTPAQVIALTDAPIASSLIATMCPRTSCKQRYQLEFYNPA